MSKLIFEKSCPERQATTVTLHEASQDTSDLPYHLQRQQRPELPEVSELQVVRHYTNLSQKNFAIDSQFYPLGSCTMKYNPKAAQHLASLSGFSQRHPLAPLQASQGVMSCMFELQGYLQQITGMPAVSLTPMAGAQGELVGVAMIRAYHEDHGEAHRDEIIVPDAAHGTNPATAVMCGYKVKEVATTQNGDVDLEALRALLSDQTAGIMLTNPSTLGVFERQIEQIATMVHDVGGLLYYDGANLNAILGQARPGDMGFDVMHMNLHKTFATPHGGGGPGSGPVAAAEVLRPYLPGPIVCQKKDYYRWSDASDLPKSIGRLSTFMGNVGIALRAYVYIRLLGKQGLVKVSELSTLNANYLQHKLQKVGFDVAYPKRWAAHEFIVTVKRQAKEKGVKATDYAKRLLDYGVHAPTMYFPLLVPECFLIEPTETETLEELDHFVEILKQIDDEAHSNPDLLHHAPYSLPVSRLDEVKAAKQLNIRYQQEQTS